MITLKFSSFLPKPASAVALVGVMMVSQSSFAGTPANIASTGFTAGDIVIDTVSGSTLDAASAITLKEFSLSNNATTATLAGTLVLPQSNSGNNYAISGEYGSATEGFLEQSSNGAYLTLVGYGVNAANFNQYTNAATTPYGNLALGQTTSLTGQSSTTVPRVVALVGANGSVNTSTALTGVFNQNNPRSAATVDGSSFYVSGQGSSKTDTATQGVFYATLGSTMATQVYSATDARAVEIINNTLYLSRDYNPPGSTSNSNPSFADVSKLTTTNGGLPTSSNGVTDTIIIPGTNAPKYQDTITVTAGNTNGVNDIKNTATGSTDRTGNFVYLSPEQYFYASPTVLYVTDSGQPKNGNANAAAEGEGGLQKWQLINGVWTLQYDLVNGLNLVNNAAANSATPTAAGVTGLFGLTGEVVNGKVELFVTTYGLNELSPSYLYEITDNLNYTTNTQAAGETFNLLYTAASGESIRGVAFAPSANVPEPSMLVMMLSGLGITRLVASRRKTV